MSQELFVESESVASEQTIHRAKVRSTAATSVRPTGVLVRGAVYGGSGYADETLAVVLGLAKRGIPVELQPMYMHTDTMSLLAPDVRDTLEVLKLQRVNPARSVLFQCLTAHDFSRDVYARFQVGRTTFETDRLPVGWLDACQAMDEVWVPSQFNRDVFAAEGVDEQKLKVLPEGVHAEIFRPDVEPLNIPHRRGFNFLSIFEWTQRKAPELLLRAYLAEFKADEDVTLIIKTYARPDPRAEILPRLVNFVEREMGLPLEKAPAIILLPGFMRNEDIPRLYRAADAFVLPSRGEGWGRPYMEALASECPVIASRWSGQTDFLHDRNSYLIDCRVVPAPANIDVELYAGHCWAEPDFDQLRHLMRHVFTHREEAKSLALQGRREMVERWDWNVIIEQWVKEFLRLLGN
jgi:glycosyltransferase involved in cell wall biosynthesis